MITTNIPLAGLLLSAVLAILCLGRLLKAFISPLRSIPGPFLARFTRFWYASHVYRGLMDHELPELHRKYGPVIRLAPDWYSLSSPAVLKPIYGFSTKFVKAPWYFGWEAPGKGGNLFSARDPRDHAERRRKVQNLYSMSSLVGYEDAVDGCIELFEKNLPRDKVIDLGHWLQCFAFDVIASVTFGSRFGFLDKGEDIGGAMSQLEAMGWYSTIMGIFNEWHAALYPFMSRLTWTGAKGREYIRDIVVDRTRQRAIDRKDNTRKDPATDSKREDFLDRMFNAHEGDPQKIEFGHIAAVGISNINAGSDTTSDSLSGILYELIRAPHTLKKLRAELLEHFSNKPGSKVDFKTAFELPYLKAVIREGMRLHPVVGLPLWRVVPAGGMTLDGVFFPEGSVVGAQGKVMHLDKDIFPEPESFRPERWIEAEGEKLREMEATWMAFGLGSRVCIGRHISELEIYKLIPRLVMRFDLEFESDGQGFASSNNWFVKAIGFKVKLKNRGEQVN